MSPNPQQSDRLIWQVAGVQSLLYWLCSITFILFILAPCKGSWRTKLGRG